MLLPGYDVRKAAQVAAFFALKAGQKINVLKLSKLIYLAEREAMARFDAPMFYDNLAALPDGPVASVTLNLINGEFEDARWSEFVAPREGNDIPVRPGVSASDLDELSNADRAILEDLWAEFGSWDRYALRDWTHKPENIPEWTDPQGSSRPIGHVEVFRSLSKTNPDELASDVQERRVVAQRLAG